VDKKVLIAIPSFDQKIHLETISSIVSVRDTLIGANIGCGMMWVRDSLVTRARNKLVASFLKQKDFELGTYDLKDNDKGFKKVNYAGTGFMCIERKVFDTIIEKYPEIEYQSDVRTKIDGKIEKPVGIKEYAFFDTGIQGKGILKDEENTQRYLSEDFFFCQLWKQCGGEIWADLTSEMKHIGIKTYERLPIIKLKKNDN
jgi:hypothetical protein